MRYTQFLDGLARFNDVITQEPIADPVYFPTHRADASFIYDRNSVTALFARANAAWMDYEWLQTAGAGNHLRDNIIQDAGLRDLITRLAPAQLPNITLDGVLAAPHDGIFGAHRLYNILHGHGPHFGMPSDPVLLVNVPFMVDEIMLLAYTAAFRNAQDSAQGLRRGQARCPNTRVVLSSADMQPATLFRNIFLIAVGNAIEVNPADLRNPEVEVVIATLSARPAAGSVAEIQAVTAFIAGVRNRIRVSEEDAERAARAAVRAGHRMNGELILADFNPRMVAENEAGRARLNARAATMQAALPGVPEGWLGRLSEWVEIMTTFRAQRAALPAAEIQAAEVILNQICAGEATTTVPARHLQCLNAWGVNAGNPAVRTPTRRAQDRFNAHNFNGIDDVHVRCQAIMAAIANIEGCGIVNAIERDHYRLHLEAAYAESAQVLAHILFSAHHFEGIADLVARHQAVLAAVVVVPAHSVSVPLARDGYTDLLRAEAGKLVTAIQAAQQRFDQDPFHQQANVALRVREIGNTAQGVRALKLPALEEAHYRALLNAEKVHLEHAMDAAQQRFLQLPFNTPARGKTVGAIRQQIQDALNGMPALGLGETEGLHCRALVTDAMAELNAPFIRRADEQFSRFCTTSFDKTSDLVRRVQLINTEIERAEARNTSDSVEHTHYLVLLRGKRNPLVRAMQEAQQCFDAHCFDQEPDLGVRRAAISTATMGIQSLDFESTTARDHYSTLLRLAGTRLAASMRMAEGRFAKRQFATLDYRAYEAAIGNAVKVESPAISDTSERRWYDSLLVKAQANLDAAKQAAERCFLEKHGQGDVFARYHRVVSIAPADIAQLALANNLARTYYQHLLENERKKLEPAIQAARRRVEEKNFDAAEPDLLKRRANIAAAVDAIDTEGIVDATEAECYRTLLMQQRDSIDLLLTRPAAEARLTALDPFNQEGEEDDDTDITRVIARAIADSIKIENPFEAENYRQLLAQMQRIVAYLRSIAQCISTAEQWVGEGWDLWRKARAVTTDGRATKLNDTLGRQYDALVCEGTSADDIAKRQPCSADSETQIAAIHVRATAMLRDIEQNLQALRALARPEVGSPDDVLPSLAGRLTMLQGQLDDGVARQEHASEKRAVSPAPLLMQAPLGGHQAPAVSSEALDVQRRRVFLSGAL